MRRTLLLVLWGALLAGCPPPTPVPSQDYEQAAIAQSYYVSYDAERDAMTVAAQFAVGGQSLQLTPPSEIEHNVFLLEESTGWVGDIDVGTVYGYWGEGYVEHHRWTWTDTAGATYINEFTFTPTRLIDPPTEISRSMGGTVSFLPAVREGERVAVYLSGSESGNGWTFSARDVGATSVEIDPDELQPRFDDDDEVEIEVWRLSTHDLQEATPAGGEIEADLESAHLTVTLVP